MAVPEERRHSTGSQDMGLAGSLTSTYRMLWILLTVLQLRLQQAQGELRCYCNLPVCITTGYMCKSEAGTCFSEHAGRSGSLSRHGCLELLHPSQRHRCQTHAIRLPGILCCMEDMCNYIHNFQTQFHLQGNVNNTYGGSFTYNEDGTALYGSSAHDATLQQDVWFRAAVIAVPIAGSCILILLILLAAHMLRQDTRRQQHLLELRRQRHFKTHLLLKRQKDENLEPHMVDRELGIYGNCDPASCRESWCTDFDEKMYIYDRPLCSSSTVWNGSKPPTLI